MPARRSASAGPNPLDPSSATDHGPRGHRARGRRLAPRHRVSRRARPGRGVDRDRPRGHPARVAGAVRRRRPAPLAEALRYQQNLTERAFRQSEAANQDLTARLAE